MHVECPVHALCILVCEVCKRSMRIGDDVPISEKYVREDLVYFKSSLLCRIGHEGYYCEGRKGPFQSARAVKVLFTIFFEMP